MGLDGKWIDKQEWLIDPGVEIPEGASNVHGYTTERIQEVGRKDAQAAIYEVYCTILEWTSENAPLVIYNSGYDCSILDRELGRQGKRFDMDGIFVVDPLCCDKAKFKFRKGSRKLVDVAPHYGVSTEGSLHDAMVDCRVTGHIALKMIESWQGTLAGLHEKQIGWKAEQSASLQSYLRSAKNKNGADPTAVVNGEWPMQSRPA